MENQRIQVEMRQKQEEAERRQVAKEQEVILNKNKARPKLSFSFGGKV